jgi:deoxyribodipyrimidine photo-lyase
VLEGLGLRYPYPSVRHHRFLLDGMAHNAAELSARNVTCVTHVASQPGAGRGLLHTLSAQACALVTDQTAMPFLRGLAGCAARAPVQAIAVDSVGLLPLSATPRAFPTAHGFRRHLQRTLPAHLEHAPHPDPTAAVALPSDPALPDLGPWAADVGIGGLPAGLDPSDLSRLPIDQGVGAVSCRGGAGAAVERWRGFLRDDLPGYAEGRNHPDDDGASGLSPWLHHGHISPFQILAELGEAAGWHPASLTPGGKGSRTGWWGLPPGQEAFLDELVTWREVGQSFVWHTPDAHTWASLPDWARATLEAHAADPRPELYDRDTLEQARTDDEIWNAAQRQLVTTGRMHNYLRMLWGKKVLQWSAHPHDALETLLYLNDKYALDGRDPNTLAGVGWVFGRFDRAWGPERPIFGKIRYMTSQSTARKLRLRRYLQTWAPA